VCGAAPYYLMAACLQVDVSTVPELRAALNDTSVRHVFMLPTGSWNFTDDAFPANSVHIMNRSVTLEGGGPGQLYLDVSCHCRRWGWGWGGSRCAQSWHSAA
jgi:hypothetical protein